MREISDRGWLAWCLVSTSVVAFGYPIAFAKGDVSFSWVVILFSFGIWALLWAECCQGFGTSKQVAFRIVAHKDIGNARDLQSVLDHGRCAARLRSHGFAYFPTSVAHTWYCALFASVCFGAWGLVIAGFQYLANFGMGSLPSVTCDWRYLAELSLLLAFQLAFWIGNNAANRYWRMDRQTFDELCEVCGVSDPSVVSLIWNACVEDGLVVRADPTGYLIHG